MLISVTEMDALLKDAVLKHSIQKVSLKDAWGHTLAEDVFSDRAQPPFDRVAMDGIAISLNAWEQGLRSFKIQDVQAAGMAALTLKKEQFCIEAMTGAVLPSGADGVIPVEQMIVDGDQVHVMDGVEFFAFKNIHRCEGDRKEGELILQKGVTILAPQMAILASVGMADVSIIKKPKITLMATGSELVAVDQVPEPYQIRMSNIGAIEARLRHEDFSDPTVVHVKDDRETLEQSLQDALCSSDIVVLSGGVSKGKFDYVPDVLQHLGVTKLCHGVKQRPGKPLWFGKTDNGTIVFAVPGNPVSYLVCWYRYIIPWIQESMGIASQQTWVTLHQDVTFKKEMTYFCPVKISYEQGRGMVATPIKTNGSGDYVSLANSDGFLELPADQNVFEVGYEARYYAW